MAGGTLNYINPNYHQSQPFPIEAPLAETVATNPAAAGVALPLLMQYQSERRSAEDAYANQVDAQHQIALQSLQEAQLNNARSRIVDILKEQNPGVLGIALSNPVTAPLFAGTDRNQLNSFNDAANRMAISKILEATGRGAQGALAGGVQVDPIALGRVIGLPTAPGQPPVVQAAGVNAAGRVAAANVSANGQPTITAPLDPKDPFSPQVHLKGNQAQAVVNSYGGLPIKGAHGEEHSSFRTNLPMAPTEGNGAAPQQLQAPTQHITAQNLAAAKTANPAAYNDIMAAAKSSGGQVQVGKSGGLIGASGKEY